MDTFNLDPLLEDPAHAFSVGVQGALAEFMRDADEPARQWRRGSWQGVLTRRGAVAVDTGQPLQICAREYDSNAPGGWRQAVGLCLDAGQAARGARRVLTELGPDRDALNPAESTAVLFDLGLGIAHVDACISTSDESLIKRLRAHGGKTLFGSGDTLIGELVKASPRRVFMTAASRIEVDTPIPLHHSADGPHTHLLPDRLGRPEVSPCQGDGSRFCVLTLHPAHPCHDRQGLGRPFDARRHAQFQTLLGRYGWPDYVACKRRVLSRIEAGGGPEEFLKTVNREQRTAVRLALRQATAEGRLAPSVLARWQRMLELCARAGGSGSG